MGKRSALLKGLNLTDDQKIKRIKKILGRFCWDHKLTRKKDFDYQKLLVSPRPRLPFENSGKYHVYYPGQKHIEITG